MNLALDSADPRPLPVQIAAGIRNLVATGALLPGERIDSTRALSAQLGVSRGTVVTAFDQLIAEGYLVAESGSGTRINPRVQPTRPPRAPAQAPAPPARARVELTPGLPDTAGLITPEWRAAWREAAVLADAPSLPHQVSLHLLHMRGLAAEPERILITAGAREGLALLLRGKPQRSGRQRSGPQRSGPLRIGVESPGYPSLRKVPAALGHELVDVPTDSEGVQVPDQPLDALIVTPSHQYPYGESLSAARRTELVAWARANHALLIEDDFDSELRYVGQPLPALATLEPERTVLLGTFSSVISPDIACGFMVAPPHLVEELRVQRQLFGPTVSSITQAALAGFLASGALRRHTGKMRRAYRRRRDLVTNTFAHIPGVELLPIHGGLHAVLLCQRPAREAVHRAGERGIGLTALADYWGGEAAPNGVVLGFGHLSDVELALALGVVAESAGTDPGTESGTEPAAARRPHG
ncbi:PLP-dependent aminotransferase family protein [Corynebacterium lizhenjunii]|uniref:PLP-dependent aminotransferase family protein n=1 Tax=Corynebacterium lizhenjunii TaxID=2709394 RepID=A0A7T0PA88_9CORY|nr:PLP-dependent aminotransferase family protein [Corynebacterium lizhenjunii]QPK78751.1 PLP-dependent aminotransferase family protein [Corynebacterium lizhenjunii]